MNRKLLVLVALGLPLAACHKAPPADNGFNEDAATFNEAAAMNASVVATSPADNAANAAEAANAAAPAEGNNAAAPAKP